ncbi:hypothetical protein PsYK624_130890 [Phanerochaete sordida]|uniref:F-box domain-containing protein n=1 Tax=Phanerochaete sordida TaxID=48140 RepID=A0A9P3LIU1_9APHY|nr:hypothetical protein PsYK624_130890 [Phanerochaete sordida]
MSSGRLPQELSDIILEDLREDKEALQRCSLVSKAWSTTSSSLLFERFRWPPCRIERTVTWVPDAVNRFCDDISGCEDALAFLVDILETSLRLRSSIRDLHLATHANHCAHKNSNGTSLFCTYTQILPLLPRLRSLSVLTWGAPAPNGIAEVPLPLHAHSIEELGISCAFESLPTLLSPFRHISALSVTCPGGPNTDETRAPQGNGLIEIHSIRVLCWDVPTLSVLRGIVNFQSVRSLKVSYAPSVTEPALGSLIQAMPALESLRYRYVDSSAAPFDTPGCLRLRSVGVGGHLLALAVVPREEQEDDVEEEADGDAEAGTPAVEDGDDEDEDEVGNEERRNLGDAGATKDEDEDVNAIQGGGLGRCEWESILRDLHILVTDVTEEITITLNIDETYTSDDASDPDDVEDIARALRKAFSLLDWDGLQSIVRQNPNLRSLRISVDYGGFLEPEECVDIFRKVFTKPLSEAVIAKITVDRA